MNFRALTALLVLTLLFASGTASQVTPHSAGFLTDPTGNLFLRVNEDGSQLMANRSPQPEYEELVSVPTSGGTETVWHRSAGRTIFNRLAFSNETLVFGKQSLGLVYCLTKAGGTPLAIANVSPDRDPRQLSLSADGKWLAFTASNFLQNGRPGRVKVNLYVAATDASKLYKVTTVPLDGKYIPFDLSSDGKTICWVDDRAQGPWVADVDGKNARRLPLGIAGAKMQSVQCDPTAAKIYCQTISASGVKLHSISRAGTGLSEIHASTHGHFSVARDAARIRMRRVENTSTKEGKLWSVAGAKLNEICTLSMPRYAGSWAWSGDGKVAVWRDSSLDGKVKTFVWRAEP